MTDNGTGAAQLDQLRIAVGEVDVLATLTTAAYDSADWSESDPAVVDRIACLLGLISKNPCPGRMSRPSPTRATVPPNST